MQSGPRARTVVFFALAIALPGVLAAAAGPGPRPESAAPKIAVSRGKIANGLPTSDFPSVGQLLTAAGSCSGTLIGCQTFLTAAHCLCTDPVSGQILNSKQCNARPDL